MSNLQQKISTIFLPLDSRSLSLFRIIFGVVLLGDLFVFRINFIDAFYFENGIINSDLAKLIANSASYTSIAPYSILHTFKSAAFVWVFFIFAIVPYVLFTIGYRSKITGLVSLFFLWNIQHRTSIVIETDDRMLLVFLFWSLFLPLDNNWAVKKTNEKISPWASWAFIIQIAIIYFFNGYPKTGEAWVNGNALQLAMQEDLWINRVPAEWIVNYPELCKFISLATKPFELLLCFIILIPFTISNYLRILAAFLMLAFHWGINVFLSFGFLPLIASAWAIALLPTPFWDKLKIKNCEETKVFSKWSILSIPIVIIFTWQATLSIPWIIETKSILPRAIENTSLTIQKWILYAPNVSSEVGWYQVKGYTNDNKELELRSNKEWNEDGSLVEAYQYECWQNFVQYILYNQPYSTTIEERWVNWECQKAKKNNLNIEMVQLFRFHRSIFENNSSISKQPKQIIFCK